MIIPEHLSENIKFYSRETDEHLAKISLKENELVVDYVKDCKNKDLNFLKNYFELNLEELQNLQFNKKAGGTKINEDGSLEG